MQGLLIAGCKILWLWLVVADPVMMTVDYVGGKKGPFKGYDCSVAKIIPASATSPTSYLGPSFVVECVNNQGHKKAGGRFYVKNVYAWMPGEVCAEPPAPVAKLWRNPDLTWAATAAMQDAFPDEQPWDYDYEDEERP